MDETLGAQFDEWKYAVSGGKMSFTQLIGWFVR